LTEFTVFNFNILRSKRYFMTEMFEAFKSLRLQFAYFLKKDWENYLTFVAIDAITVLYVSVLGFHKWIPFPHILKKIANKQKYLCCGIVVYYTLFNHVETAVNRTHKRTEIVVHVSLFQ